MASDRLRKITIYSGLMHYDLPYSPASKVSELCDKVVQKAMDRYPIFKNDSYGFKYDNGSGKLTLVFKATWLKQYISDDCNEYDSGNLAEQLLFWFGDYIFDHLSDGDISIEQFYTVFETESGIAKDKSDNKSSDSAKSLSSASWFVKPEPALH